MVHRLVGRKIDVRGVGIWTELHGPPDGTPVVLVQRMAAQGFEWLPGQGITAVTQ